jgi:hypothetical protein
MVSSLISLKCTYNIYDVLSTFSSANTNHKYPTTRSCTRKVPNKTTQHAYDITLFLYTAYIPYTTSLSLNTLTVATGTATIDDVNITLKFTLLADRTKYLVTSALYYTHKVCQTQQFPHHRDIHNFNIKTDRGK